MKTYWTVILDTPDDGVQKFRFEEKEQAMGFAKSQEECLLEIIEEKLIISI